MAIDLRVLVGSQFCVVSLNYFVVCFREELGKSINTDEAAALGAVYQAAHLSKGFKVKKFIVKDANLYPIQVCKTDPLIGLGFFYDKRHRNTIKGYIFANLHIPVVSAHMKSYVNYLNARHF